MDDRESQADMRCIAVPILDREGRAAAAISATDDIARMTPERQVEVRDALLQVSATLRQKLYPTPSFLHSRRPMAAE
jgi:DNA-binding IclR family transcriptional regulator